MTSRPTRFAAACLALAALAALAPRIADVQAKVETAPKQDLRSPDTRDAANGRGTYTAPNVVILKVSEPVAEESGIDWADAGIGAAGTLGVMLLGFGGSLAVLHRRQAGETRI